MTPPKCIMNTSLIMSLIITLIVFQCAAFDHFDPDRRGLWVRHADTHAQANSYRPRVHPGRMSALAAAAVAQSCAVEPEFRSRRAEVSA